MIRISIVSNGLSDITFPTLSVGGVHEHLCSTSAQGRIIYLKIWPFIYDMLIFPYIFSILILYIFFLVILFSKEK